MIRVTVSWAFLDMFPPFFSFAQLTLHHMGCCGYCVFSSSSFDFCHTSLPSNGGQTVFDNKIPSPEFLLSSLLPLRPFLEAIKYEKV